MVIVVVAVVASMTLIACRIVVLIINGVIAWMKNTKRSLGIQPFET